MLQVFDRLEPLVAGVLNDLFTLPVRRDDGSVADPHRGHLEGEEVQVRLICCLAHGVVARVEHGAILQEPA